VQEITPFLPGDTVAYLRLADEERKFPFRPISPGLFLIGQGPGCDLRLGLEEMPPIHSAIQMSESGAELTKIAESPELFVNGEPVDHLFLEHGDLIEVGDVRLAFFLCNHSAANAAERPIEHSKLSARQLIDGLEFELDLLDADSNRTGRISDLLKAAQQAVDACQFAQTIRFADYASQKAAPETPPQSDSYLQVLNRLSSQETRLDEICNVLEQVVHQQQMIATALQCVVERLDDMRSGVQPGSMRASA
jgi:hypothetical protein